MKYKTHLTLITAIFTSIFGVAGAQEIRTSPTEPQNIDQVASLNRETREFGHNDYIITPVAATQFQGDNGVSLSYVSYYYYQNPTSSTNDYFGAQLSLPNGAQICYLDMFAYDNDPTNNISLSLRQMTGYDDTVIPSGSTLDSISSSGIATTNHYGYVSGMINPQTSTPPLSFTYPGCRTINNDVRFNSGAHYFLELYIPAAAGANLKFRAADVWWKRQISPAPATASFSDVPTSHWAFQYVEALYASNITTGCAAGTFCPDNTVTRAEMATFLARALGLHWGKQPGFLGWQQ